jgi:hypothetical protein
MVVPSTADGFRTAISTLRSLDGKEGVSFQTFTLPVDRCVRLLVKNLGRVMPESVVREELELLDSCPGSHAAPIWASRSAPREGPPSHTSHYRVGGESARGVKVACTYLTLWVASVGGNVRVSKRPVAMQALPGFRHTQRNCGYAPRCVACGSSHLSGRCSTPREQPHCCGCGRKAHGELLRVC